MMLSYQPLQLLFLALWAVVWLAGGVWLTQAAFRLGPKEEFLAGLALGWIVETWLANLLARLMPVAAAFWLSAGLVFLAGLLALGLGSGWKALLRGTIPPLQVLALAGTALFFYSAVRGLAIFDDFQHLATISMIAAGDFPPHFALDPQVLFGYHHFLQLLSAQIMRLGGLSPWAAVDAARALTFATAVLLAYTWTRRVTRSAAAGLLGSLLIAFGSGTRWLLLLLPPSIVAWIGKSMQLIGSGAGSGAHLSEALTNFWAVEGSGPVGFPFAFANGIFPAGVIQAQTANGLAPFVLIFLLLLTFNCWRNSMVAAVLSAVLISVWGLLGEAELPGILAGWGVVALACMLINRKLALPRSLWAWLAVGGAGVMIGFLEGGALTDILLRAADKLSGAPQPPSYQTIGFQLAWPPAIVSSHLGVLSLFNPALLIAAVFELGPVLLVFPLLVIWGIKAFRLRRWFEAAIVATAVVMLLMVFVQFNGSTGVRNTPRLYVFMPILTAFAVPLAWIWAAHRSDRLKLLVAVIGLVTMLGGVVMTGVSLIAAQRPVFTYYVGPLDYRMSREYWNRLAPEALVFDSIAYRPPTLFGRATDSSYTWYAYKPEWETLRRSPDPVKLHAAGFRYLYLDENFWKEIDPQMQKLLGSGGCTQLVREISDDQGRFRRLLDLDGCR